MSDVTNSMTTVADIQKQASRISKLRKIASRARELQELLKDETFHHISDGPGSLKPSMVLDSSFFAALETATKEALFDSWKKGKPRVAKKAE